MIGKICSSQLSYYDMKTGKDSFKFRPVLVIGGPRNDIYTVLPISTVTRRQNLDKDYDIEIQPSKFPLLNLKKNCYIRTHKQTTVHKKDMRLKPISDMKNLYEGLYLYTLEKLKEFNKEIINKAI